MVSAKAPVRRFDVTGFADYETGLMKVALSIVITL